MEPGRASVNRPGDAAESMPYTIHLAPTREAAAGADADLSLDYHVHQAIFGSDDVALHDLTLFYHLSDFYQDASFLDGQVLGLRTEVEEARARIHDPRATAAMSALAKLCDEAMDRGLNVFAFAE
jgi:hypothetical protein